MTQKLDRKQKRFVQEYLVDFNASRAARAAGYQSSSAGQIGHQLLKQNQIRRLIAEGSDKVLKRARLETEDIIDMMEDLALEDLRGGFDDDGNLLPMSQWSDAFARSVESIETAKIPDPDDPDRLINAIVKIKRTPSRVGIDMLAKHHSLYNEVLQVKGFESLGERLNRGKQRVIADETED